MFTSNLVARYGRVQFLPSNGTARCASDWRVLVVKHRGFFLIADITGYTTYLNDSELEHAQQTLTDLLELLVDQTRPPLTVTQLEGDAVLSYALAEARTGLPPMW